MPSDRPFPPRTQQAGRRRLVCQIALLAAFGAVLGGCAAPGEPSVRRPAVPQTVTDLAAHQQGSAVVLDFTLPDQSSEKKPLGERPTVEVYRGAPKPAATAPPGSQPPVPARLVDTIPGDTIQTYEKDGRVEFRDPLDPAQLAGTPGQEIAYFVRTRISSKRASADSNAVTLHVYPAPGAIAGLRATVTQQSVDLAWAAPQPAANAGTVAGYRVYRAEVDPENTAAATADPSKAKLRAPLELLGQVSEPEYHDAHFEFGRTYLYIVRSVAQFGSSAVESTDTDAAVTPKDVFPPGAPQDLVAVVVPATPEAPAYVEVTWSISMETDWAGYVVYRSEQPDTPGDRMTVELLLSPTFRDISVLPGRRYFYRIGAVDVAGNQSALSSAIAVAIPELQPQ